MSRQSLPTTIQVNWTFSSVVRIQEGSVKLRAGSTAQDICCLLGDGLSLPPQALRLVQTNGTELNILPSNSRLSQSCHLFVVLVDKQILLIFGALEPKLQNCIENMFRVSFQYHEQWALEICNRECPSIIKITRVVFWQPQIFELVERMRQIALQARMTEVVIVCHSVERECLLMKNGEFPITQLHGINDPIVDRFIMLLSTQTCFASDGNYIRAIVEGSDLDMLSILSGMQNIGGKVLASDAIQSIVDLVQSTGFVCTEVDLTFTIYLDKWRWPHDQQVNKLTGQKEQVKEQFGETFHVAVLVSVFPDVLGKFSKPSASQNNMHMMNTDQYDYLTLVQHSAYSCTCPNLSSQDLRTAISKIRRYSHNNLSDYIIDGAKNNQLCKLNLLQKIQTRMVGKKTSKASTTAGVAHYVLLCVRKSSGSTSSEKRDMPDEFIIKFLQEHTYVVVVGNAVPSSIVNTFQQRSDIIYKTEIWKSTPDGQNKFRYQLQYYDQLRYDYNIQDGVGMWSGQLDMYALLGLNILRIAPDASYIKRIEGWSEALGLTFSCYELFSKEWRGAVPAGLCVEWINCCF